MKLKFILIIFVSSLTIFFIISPAKANVLTQQPLINAHFYFPNELKFFGNLNLWTNNTGGTTTIYTLFIKAALDPTRSVGRLYDIELNKNLELYCLDNLGNPAGSYEQTLKCDCIGDCDVGSGDTIQYVYPYVSNSLPVGVIELAGLDLGITPVGAVWVSSDNVFLNPSNIVYPTPAFAQMAWFLCDNQATSTTCNDKKFIQLATSTNPYPVTGTSTALNLCLNIKPTSNFDVIGGIQFGLCNVFQWLFFPSSVSTDSFQSLTTTFQSKAPFAYFYSITGALNSLSATATPAFSLSTSTGALDTTIFQPLKTGLIWLLWIMFAVFCIKRIAKFDF